MAADLAEHDTHASADPAARLDAALRAAIISVLGEDAGKGDPSIRPSAKPEFGDYQANFAMGMAKKLGRNPRELAQQVVDAAEVADFAEPLEVAGPGFINIRLKGETLANLLAQMDASDLGVARSSDTHDVAIDLCGVNVAKQTHVGHLRSTIIGDALARVFERTGRTVHRENHLGDWGLPIAMVLHQLREHGANLEALDIDALDAAYRDAQLTTRSDIRGLAAAHDLSAGPHRIAELEEQNSGAHEALDAAKATLLKLQSHDPGVEADWRKLIDVTMASVYESFDMMSVKLGPENNRGESTYREQLPEIVDAFVRAGLATEDDGALVVRFDDRDRPLLIRKSDGGFLYATTDLAAIRHRVQNLGATRVIYVVDARQRDHFRDVFDAARLIGWDKLPDGATAELTHIPFGSVLGENKKPLKTRSGENVTLKSLLVEAIERGSTEVIARAQDEHAPTHGLTENELRAIGKSVGIGAVKYADLSNDLVRDYVFSFDRMLAFEGDTGPYLQYAHARICSIFTKAPPELAYEDAPLNIVEPAEKQLALRLLRYGQTVDDVARSLEPHRLCAYLYDLADAYSTFYQHCSVLHADDEATIASRLRLCDLTRRVLADGLSLLGIDAPTRM